MAHATHSPSTLRRLPPWAAPVAVLVALLLIAVAVIVIANRSGGSGAPPRAGAFDIPAPAESFAAFNVRQADGAVLTVAPSGGGSATTVEIDGSVRVETLIPATPADIAVGDWLVVVAIPNEVRNFAITRLVVIPEPGGIGDDGFARSAGGFLGAEGSRQSDERAVLGGQVLSVDSDQAVLEGPEGDIVVTFEQGSPPVYILDAVPAENVQPGDRLVVAGEGPLDTAEAILVLPEGLGE